jgi:hypothetical protein
MPSEIICLGALIEGSTTICSRRYPEFAFVRIQKNFEPIVINRHLSPSSRFFRRCV